MGLGVLLEAGLTGVDGMGSGLLGGAEAITGGVGEDIAEGVGVELLAGDLIGFGELDTSIGAAGVGITMAGVGFAGATAT